MGYGSYTAHDWERMRTTRGITEDSKASNLFKNRTLLPKFDPKNISMRESHDNEEHPMSTPIAIGVDVTGSMGYLSEQIIKESLEELMKKLYASNAIPDPQIMFAAIGDASCDKAPLQETQFEADIRVAEQLLELWLEGKGGDAPEDYSLLWYFLARHTVTDSMKKRNQKGFAFTIGDAKNHPVLKSEDIKRVFGDDVPMDMTREEIVAETLQSYHLYHINIISGSEKLTVIEGRTVNIPRTNINLLPELIISIMCKVKGIKTDGILGDLRHADKSMNVEFRIKRMMKDIEIWE